MPQPVRAWRSCLDSPSQANAVGRCIRSAPVKGPNYTRSLAFVKPSRVALRTPHASELFCVSTVTVFREMLNQVISPSDDALIAKSRATSLIA